MRNKYVEDATDPGKTNTDRIALLDKGFTENETARNVVVNVVTDIRLSRGNHKWASSDHKNSLRFHVHSHGTRYTFELVELGPDSKEG